MHRHIGTIEVTLKIGSLRGKAKDIAADYEDLKI